MNFKQYMENLGYTFKKKQWEETGSAAMIHGLQDQRSWKRGAKGKDLDDSLFTLENCRENLKILVGQEWQNLFEWKNALNRATAQLHDILFYGEFKKRKTYEELQKETEEKLENMIKSGIGRQKFDPRKEFEECLKSASVSTQFCKTK